MKNKLIGVSIILIFLFTSLISVNAIAPTPRIDLNEYEITTNNTNNVDVSGTISISKGQLIGVYNSNEKILYNYIQTKNSNSKESFTIQIPARYLTKSNNTFKIKSLPIKDVINASNAKTLTVKINSIKQNQTITANNISLNVGEKKNLNAKVSSGLPLTYKSENSNIATVDAKGNVVGRKAGTSKVTISQAGNSQYNPVSKTITISVNNNTPTNTSKTNISKAKISNLSSKYIWESKAVTPVPKLTLNNKTLKQNVDYTVTYVNNKEPGSAKIIITGKGNYTGTINKVFTIYINDTKSIKPKKGGKSYYKTITLSGRTFRLYKQGGAFYSNWKFNYNNKSTIKGNGCGPVAIADIMSGYGYDMHPGQVAKDATKYAKQMYKEGKSSKKSCKGKTAWGKYLRHYGFKAIVHTNINESDAVAEKNIRNALNKGHQVWLQVGKGSKKWRKFTASGWHNIALLGIDKTGKYAYVANSSGSAKKWCKISDLAKGRLKYKNRKYGYIEIWKPVD